MAKGHAEVNGLVRPLAKPRHENTDELDKVEFLAAPRPIALVIFANHKSLTGFQEIIKGHKDAECTRSEISMKAFAHHMAEG